MLTLSLNRISEIIYTLYTFYNTVPYINILTETLLYKFVVFNHIACIHYKYNNLYCTLHIIYIIHTFISSILRLTHIIYNSHLPHHFYYTNVVLVPRFLCKNVSNLQNTK